jgi:hypothetical protein
VAPWLRPGITVGFISGSVWLVYNLVNNLGDLSGGQNAALSVAGLGVTVSLFTLAGFRGSARTGRVRTGALTGLWAALVSSTVGITTLWAITLAAMDTIRRNGLMVADSGHEIPDGRNHGIGRLLHEPVARTRDNLAADVRRHEFGLLDEEGAAGLLARQNEQRHCQPRAAHPGEVLGVPLQIAEVLEARPHGAGLCVGPGVDPAIRLGHGAFPVGGEVGPSCTA